jgi:hypothetical protein
MVLSVYQAFGGRYSIVSLPHGANSAKKALSTALEWLNGFDKVILAFDADEPGKKAMEECSQLFDPTKVRICNWTKKDPNEMLIAGEDEAIRKCVWNAQEIRPQGIIDLSEITADDFNDLAVKGYDMPFPQLNAALGGLRQRTLNTLVAREKSGKMFSLDTLIPTPEGMKELGDLSVGDVVLSSYGEETTINYISPHHYMDCYNFRTTCGQEVITGRDHLWIVKETHWDEYKTLSTQDILDLGVVTSKGRNKWSILPTEAVKGVYKKLPIDPYSLGIWLGDGDSNSRHITGLKEDLEAYGKVIELKKDKRKENTYRGKIESINNTLLRDAGVFKNKHIPEQYFYASIDQRLELLKGILDTDGHISRDGRIEFTQARLGLMMDVIRLLNSLGIVTKSEPNVKIVKGKEYYRISFTSSMNVFKLPRKSERFTPKRGRIRKIESITPVDTVPTVCISVDSPNHSYLYGMNYVVTHNTTLTKEIALHLTKTGQCKVGLLYLEGDAKLEGISLGAMELNTPMWQIESRLDDPEIQKDILPKLAELGKSGLYLYDHKGAISAEQVFNSINYMIKGLGCDVIVLDNLSITIAGDSGEQNERKMIDTLVYKIVKLIQETGACILNVVHAVKNRKTKDGQDSEKITRSDIHGSGAFAKFSNSVFAIEREESEVNLKVLANRFKGIDGYMDTLQYNASTGRLEVIESVIGE